MGKELMTAGYGNQKPDDFLARLKTAGVTWVFDVRREGALSWNGRYRHGVQMEALLAHGPIGYSMEIGLGNRCCSLGSYRTWIEVYSEAIEHLAAAFDVGLIYETPCLLCSERDAYKYGEVNCHRVYVADALVKELGDGWTTRHI